ncbi:MAG: alpha/beta hydrolase [Gemmatimonadaceae bacterium]
MGSDDFRRRPDDIFPAGVAGVDQRFLQLASGLRVRIVEAGVGNPKPTVLVPGWGCTAWVFHETLLPLAASGFHAIAVELKGQGMSDMPSGAHEYTIASMRDNLLEIVDALEVGPVGLVGHSMGAAIAANASAVAPDRVTGLVLGGPVGFAGVPGMGMFRALSPPAVVPVLPALATRTTVRMMLNVVDGPSRTQSQQDVDEFYAPTRQAGYIASLRHLLHSFRWSEPFPKLTVPYMRILGGRDVLSPPTGKLGDDGREFRKIVIQNAGHLMFAEAAPTVNSALIEFFGSRAAPYITNENEQTRHEGKREKADCFPPEADSP